MSNTKLPARDVQKSAEEQGLFNKFHVERTDGSSEPGGKHHGCNYFVLDVDHDKHAKAALTAYANEVEDTHPILAREMRENYGLADRERQAGEAVACTTERLTELAKPIATAIAKNCSVAPQLVFPHLFLGLKDLFASLPAPQTVQAESMRERLQKQCSAWGAYWRASDAHGVELTKPQAIELLQDALGVEVEIKDNGCQACDGTGMIGGPSYYSPDEGGVPCPDCAAPSPVGKAEQAEAPSAEDAAYENEHPAAKRMRLEFEAKYGSNSALMRAANNWFNVRTQYNEAWNRDREQPVTETDVEEAERAMLATQPTASPELAEATNDREAHWFALVQGAASEIENAANCLQDPDAKRVAISGAEHYRAKAKELSRRGKSGVAHG